MAVIYMPSVPAFKASEFGLQYNTTILESPFTKAQQVIERTGAQWRATYNLPPMKREQAALWQAFLTALKGQVNTFMAYDPDAVNPRGLVPLAPFGFNQVRNGDATGGTVGVVGSGGNLPTNWTRGYAGAGNNAAVPVTVEAINQTANGVQCFRMRVNGTPAANGAIFIRNELDTIADAVQGQTWTQSMFIGLYAGSFANTTIKSWVREQLANGSFLVEGTSTSFAAQITADISKGRITHTRTLTNASTAKTSGGLWIDLIAGQAVDFTVLVGAAQNEQRSFASPYIGTTNAIAFRSDGVRVFGVGQTGKNLAVRGFTANANGVLLAGDYVNVGTGLYMVAENANTDYRGVATLKLANPLRGTPVNDSLLTTTGAVVEMRLVDDGQASWEADHMGVYGINFSAVEVLA